MSAYLNNNYNQSYRQYRQPQYQQQNNYRRPAQQHNYQQDSRSVDTNKLLSFLSMADRNRDGLFNRYELYNGARIAADYGQKQISEAIATMFAGGTNGKGLLPTTTNQRDQYGLAVTSATEITDLANFTNEGSKNNYDRISSADFKAAFPDRAVDGGNEYNPYQPPQNNYNKPNNGMQIPPQFVELLIKLLTSLMRY